MLMADLVAYYQQAPDAMRCGHNPKKRRCQSPFESRYGDRSPETLRPEGSTYGTSHHSGTCPYVRTDSSQITFESVVAGQCVKYTMYHMCSLHSVSRMCRRRPDSFGGLTDLSYQVLPLCNCAPHDGVKEGYSWHMGHEFWPSDVIQA
jgi:hypothetical protein